MFSKFQMSDQSGHGLPSAKLGGFLRILGLHDEIRLQPISFTSHELVVELLPFPTVGPFGT